ncbi:MAG: hypothetical protein ACPLY7_01775, partial [Microgenomates group bacterium]
LTEDQGAALEGVIAVVYPELVRAVRQEIYPDLFPLLGNWHEVPTSKDSYHKAFISFLEIVNDFIGDKSGKRAREDLQRFLDLTEKDSFLSRKRIPDFSADDLGLHWRIKEIKETSSRVIKVYFAQESQRRILQLMKTDLGLI